MKRAPFPLLAFVVIASTFGEEPAPTTALQVQAARPPQRVHGSDEREHIEYNLVITNDFTADATLTSLVVRGDDGKNLLDLRGEALGAFTRETTGLGEPRTTIPRSSAVTTFVDVVLPNSTGRSVPMRLENRLAYTIPPDAPIHTAIGSLSVDAPILEVDRRVPLTIAPPLRGAGWLSANACCGDPTLNHRTIMLAVNGAYKTQELFAVDYIRMVNGRIFTGDGTRNEDWFGYAQGVFAVALGQVVLGGRRPA